jgi:hypothetical protein
MTGERKIKLNLIGLLLTEEDPMRSLKVLAFLFISNAALADGGFIIPGISVGKVALGASEWKVESLLGKPESRGTSGVSYKDLDVSYNDQQVSEITVTSARYGTKEGITIKSTPREFKRTFKGLITICDESMGASGGSFATTYDAVSTGIALVVNRHTSGGSYRELIVHRPRVATTIYGEITPCGK